jgi:hypothetical protein
MKMMHLEAQFNEVINQTLEALNDPFLLFGSY